jgi:hypothetical protein
MKPASTGGLWGKARYVHRRDRAERGFAELLVEDYLEPEPVLSGSGAFAPIRGRSEFLPSAFEMEEWDMRTETQLEFPLVESETEPRPSGRAILPERRGVAQTKACGSGRHVVWSTNDEETEDSPDFGLLRIAADEQDEPDSAEPTISCDQTSQGAEESLRSDDEPIVLRLPRRARANMPLGWSHELQNRKTSRLTIRGFVTGCLIGGVAAAAALTVLNITLR